MTEATAATFEAAVIEASREQPVLVDFWAPWCQPCRVVGPVLEDLEREAGGKWKLVKVNVQVEQELGARFGISSIPAMKLFSGGQVAAEMVGALPKPNLRQWLDQHVPGEEAALTARGDAALASGDVAAAEAAYRDALRHRPDHAAAKAGLARVLARAGRADEARSLATGLTGRAGAVARLELEAASADVGAEGVAGQYARALRDAVGGRTEEALGALLEVVRKDRKFGDDAARKRMLDVFEASGDKAVVDAWQRRLASVLFC